MDEPAAQGPTRCFCLSALRRTIRPGEHLLIAAWTTPRARKQLPLIATRLAGTPPAPGSGAISRTSPGQPLAPRTREAYGAHVSAYIEWLAERPGAGAALREPRARDHAARDFKRYLKLERRWAPSSVNLALAAVDHFNRFLGLGPAVVSREQLAQAAPRALDDDEQRALLRAAESARRRDRAIVVVLLHTALRLSELVALDVDDARVSARKGVVIVRSGKGDAHREIPLKATARAGARRVAERPPRASRR
jgi:site-specific recombinase XerD